MTLKRMAIIGTLLALTLCLSIGGITVSAAGTYTPGAEMLTNGDFEQGTMNWASEETDPGHVWYKEGVGRDGSAGFELCKIGDESGTQKQYYREVLNLVPGNRYVLSFDYLANPNNTFYISSNTIGCYREGSVILGDDADGAWHTYAKTFVVPAKYEPKASVLAITSSKVGEIPAVIDNISIHECNLEDKPQSVALSHNELALPVGDKQTLGVDIEPYMSDMNNATWVSDNEAVATVKYGIVTAVSEGTATITMTAPNGLTDTCAVTVVPAKESEADLVAESLTWTDERGQVQPDKKLKFTVTVKNNGTADVTEPFDVDISMGLERLFRITYDGGVKAGESVTITSKTWKAVKGDHMMAVHVNPTLTAAESDTLTNNTYQINLRVSDDLLKPTGDKVIPVVEEAGMTNLTFSDDFDTLDVVDRTASGRAGYKWYVTRPYGATTLIPSDYSVNDGVMTLHLADPTYNYGLSTTDIPTWAGYTFQTGYLEFRVRMPHYDGSKRGGPAIWSMPKNKLHEQAKMWIEMDWMEYWGVDNKHIPGYYTITMHEQWVDENIQVTDWYSNKGRGQLGFGDGEFHTLGCLWEKNSLRCYYDGEPVFEQKWKKGEPPEPINDTSKGEVKFDDVFSYMEEQVLPFFISASADNPMEIDYIRVWQNSEQSFDEHTAALTETDFPTVYVAVGIGGIVLIAILVIVLIALKRKTVTE